MKRMRVAVVGLGEFGEALALELARLGCEVLAVDRSTAAADRLRDQVAQSASADVRSKEALRELFNTPLDAVVVALGSSLESSLLAVLHLQELEIPRIAVEVSTAEAEELMKRIGVQEVFAPERDSGIRMAHRILNPDLVGYLPALPGLSVVEVEAPEWMHGERIDALGLRERHVSVVSLRRPGGEVSVVPGPEETVGPGDRLTLVGRDEGLEELAEPRE